MPSETRHRLNESGLLPDWKKVVKLEVACLAVQPARTWDQTAEAEVLVLFSLPVG